MSWNLYLLECNVRKGSLTYRQIFLLQKNHESHLLRLPIGFFRYIINEYCKIIQMKNAYLSFEITLNH